MSSIEEIKKKNQRTLIMLVLAFLAPVMAAYLIYLNMGKTSSTRNNGDLITPALPLTDFSLNSLDGKAFGMDELKGSWHLVYIGKGPCAEVCQNRLSTMHQTRMAQGSAMSRVRLLYISLDKPQVTESEKLLRDYARLTILNGDDAHLDKTLQQFTVGAVADIREDNLIFMVDPLGNLMMRYKKEIRLIGIIKDLEHLLKYSQIG